MVFYSKRPRYEEEYPIPEGEEFEEYREQMVEWIKEKRSREHKDFSVRSFDGLTLRGKYYEYSKDAPIEILFHGYKGTAERDLSGGIARCRGLGHSVLIVDHRASGESDGNVITFGINESKDAEKWVELVLKEINPDAKIILGGVSMGAATVMMCASKEFPKNVIGGVADCGYTSAREIIKKVCEDMKLPDDLLYPFIKLGARLFGKFDLDENSPIESVKNSRIPIIFLHGDKDGFVPYEMGVENHNACTSEKRFVNIEGAGHGLAFPANQQKYLEELESFFEPYLR
jgi:fermentation-respiration switch protein FrsA (DUF1100 family)